MKEKLLIIICVIILVTTLVPPIALAEDRTDSPGGYVITDGTSYFWIDYDELMFSYVYYSRIDPDCDEAKLAKFYFDTLGSVAAYVSRVTTKFVSYQEVLTTYAITRDVDATYIWFNSSDPADATPAFDVTTEVMVMGPDGTVTGSVYVGADGYIIILPNQGIMIPGFTSITIDANQTNVIVDLKNPAGNTCYFVISLILDDGTVLYQSNMLLPGEGVSDIVLSQPLAYGEYDASVLYEAFNADDLSPLNSAEVEITIIAN